MKAIQLSFVYPAWYLKNIGDLIFGQKNLLNTIEINLNIVVFIHLDTLLILLRILF